LNNPSRNLQVVVWGGLAAVIVGIAVAFVRSKNPAPETSAPLPPVIGQVADFALTNQNNLPVTLANLRGQVWVADIIFTRCPGPCARMTRQLRELQIALPATSRAQLVSLTTDAEFDTPPVLQKYATRFEANSANWQFLTGDPRAVATLAIDSLKLTALEKPAAERTSPEDLFVHSTIFVVVDKQAQLRGVFETGGDGVDWNKSKADILALVAQLEAAP
jgi:protein SCO1/2